MGDKTWIEKWRDQRGGAATVETIDGHRFRSNNVKLYDGFLSLQTPECYSYAEAKWRNDTGFSTITLCLPYQQVKMVKLGATE